MTETYLTFDIETIPLEWSSFSESQQEYLLRGATNEEEQKKKLDEMALTPYTGQVVCLGLQIMKMSEDNQLELINKGAYIVDPSAIGDKITEVEKLAGGSRCFSCSEKKLLEQFWLLIGKYDPVHLISFNGRNFDAPFIMLRSALLGVKPSRNLMSGTKFNYPLHTDLIDELTFYSGSFYGATRRFNFDFYTRAFGLTSPKSEGIDGSKVQQFYHEGKLREIAEYCLRDVTATWELFLIWKKYLGFGK